MKPQWHPFSLKEIKVKYWVSDLREGNILALFNVFFGFSGFLKSVWMDFGVCYTFQKFKWKNFFTQLAEFFFKISQWDLSLSFKFHNQNNIILQNKLMYIFLPRSEQCTNSWIALASNGHVENRSGRKRVLEILGSQWKEEVIQYHYHLHQRVQPAFSIKILQCLNMWRWNNSLAEHKSNC